MTEDRNLPQDDWEPTGFDDALRAAFADPRAATPPDPSRNERDRYQIGEELGRGGVGVVRQGEDLTLERTVAVKTLHRLHARNPAMVQRFLREARIGGRLQHPGIVPIYDMGFEDGGEPFFTMRLLEGQSLAEHLKGRRDPEHDLSRFLKIFEQVCQAIAYAHSRQVLHRDLKPENVMLGQFGEVQVVDWGFAKILTEGSEAPGAEGLPEVPEDASGAVSQPGSVMGTPAYMSPEQAQGKLDEVDLRADVFALGSMLCEILTGSPVYRGDSRSTLIAATNARLEDAWERLEHCAADAALVSLAQRCLAKDPEERPADASRVAAEVEQYLTSMAERTHQAELSAAEARGKASEEVRRRRVTFWLAACIVLITAVAGTWWMRNQRQRDERLADARTRFELRYQLTTERLSAAEELPPNNREALELSWNEVESRLEHTAEVLTAHPELDTLESRLAELRTRMTNAKSESLEGNRLYTQLEELPALWVILPMEEVAEKFRETFLSAGLDFDTMSEQALIERMVNSRLRMVFADAMFAYARTEVETMRHPNGLPEEERTRYQKWLRILASVDPDPVRVRIRAATMKNGSRQALLEIAQGPGIDEFEFRNILYLGFILADFGELEESVHLFRSQYHRFSDQVECSFQLGEWLTRTSPPQWEEAARYYTAAVSANPQDPAGWCGLSRCLRESGEWLGAMNAATKARELAPELWKSRLENARCLDRLGDLADAEKLYQSLEGDTPFPWEVTAEWADLQGRLGDVVSAKEGLKEALPRFRDVTPVARILEELRQYGPPEEAEAICERVATQWKQPAELRIPWARTLLDQGRYEEALRMFRRAPDHPPSVEWALHCRNLLLAESHLTKFRESGELPTRLEEQTLLAQLLEYENDWQSALQVWDRCTRSPMALRAARREGALLDAARTALRFAQAGDRSAAEKWLPRARQWVQWEVDHLAELNTLQASALVRGLLRDPTFRATRSGGLLANGEWEDLWERVLKFTPSREN